MMKDTIFAPATPVGGALCIVRISGGNAIAAVVPHFSGRLEKNRVSFGRVTGFGRVLDTAVAACYTSPQSYTGEDTVELFLHGSRAVVDDVSKLLISLGIRPAQPGEFTKRAFLNGRMELSEAEAVMDVINAYTDKSAAAALDQLEGSVSRAVAGVESELYDALSTIDAFIDFPEELEGEYKTMADNVERAITLIEQLLDTGARGQLLREGARVVLAGKPNAGKSSLLNALLGRERAIVTPIAGTTRDVIEEQTDFCGVPVRLYDTAGITDTDDPVEQIGVMRARAALEGADLVMVVLDCGVTPDEYDETLLTAGNAKTLAVAAKSDLPAVIDARWLNERYNVASLDVSALSGSGVSELKALAASLLAGADAGKGRIGESALVTNARHISALSDAKDALIASREAVDIDCAATDIRDALEALGAISGKNVDEATIDMIFARFCVGK